MTNRPQTSQQVTPLFPGHGKVFTRRHVAALLGLNHAQITRDATWYLKWLATADEIAVQEPEEAFMHALQIATVIASRLRRTRSIDDIVTGAVHETKYWDPRYTASAFDCVADVFATLLHGGENPDDVADAARAMAHETFGTDEFMWVGAARRARNAMTGALVLCTLENPWPPRRLLLHTLAAMHGRSE